MSGLQVSIDEPALRSNFKTTTQGPGTLLGTDVEISVSVDVKSYDGMEKQRIETTCPDSSSRIHGVFQISFGGASTRFVL
jgi:hypothetical protein